MIHFMVYPNSIRETNCMPVIINGQTYYRTAEVCQIAGTSRNTFFRWCREGLFEDVKFVDRRGWRLFTKDDLDRLKAQANRVRPNDHRQTKQAL